ncbi:MAG TPA: nitroreductase family protein [Roseiflexaceae bacterium]|nr:nitroreductase family protein [Roseiflexaceae bacterium]HMP39662.1 nitroreductase family protein [Roseiflexaceae bacterium]
MKTIPASPGDPPAAHRDLPLAALISGRRSVRRFRPDPVAHADLYALLEAARWAPSPHGRQPWRFVVLTRPELRRQLADAMGAEWHRQLALDGQDAAEVERRLQISRIRITSAPAIIIPCLYLADLDVYPDAERNAAEQTMAIQSLGCAIQNMLLSAYQRGLDTGWMCAPLFCPEVVVAALALDTALIPHALIPVGYAAVDPVRRPRRPLDELIARFD